MIPFATVYNPSFPNIGATIHKYWDILHLSSTDEVKWIHENFEPMLAYKRPKSLHDHVTVTKFSKYDENMCMSESCYRLKGVVIANLSVEVQNDQVLCLDITIRSKLIQMVQRGNVFIQ